MNLDKLDLEIIKILSENSKLTFKEIGEQVYLTGQAVGARVNKLVAEGVIENFTININKEKLGIKITAMIKVFMKTHNHSQLKALINSNDEIVEAFRISADCCYFFKVETTSNQALNSILDEISKFATYQLFISVAKLK